MKTHEQKARELIMAKKQMTFDIPDTPQTEEKRKKVMLGKPKPTYWVCINSHVFEHKHRVHPDREEEMKCSICGGAVKNKSTKTTYLYYLNRTGRGDVKEYRADKIRGEKKRIRTKTNCLENMEQESDV